MCAPDASTIAIGHGKTRLPEFTPPGMTSRARATRAELLLSGAMLAPIPSYSLSRATPRLPDLDDHLDLDSIVHWDSHADSAACMSPGLAKDLEQQVTTPVDDGGRVIEVGCYVDHTEDLYDPEHRIQT